MQLLRLQNYSKSVKLYTIDCIVFFLEWKVHHYGRVSAGVVYATHDFLGLVWQFDVFFGHGQQFGKLLSKHFGGSTPRASCVQLVFFFVDRRSTSEVFCAGSCVQLMLCRLSLSQNVVAKARFFACALGPWCGFALFRYTGRISDRSLWGSFVQFLPSPPAPLGKGFSFVQQACPCKRVGAKYIIIIQSTSKGLEQGQKTMSSIILPYCYNIILRISFFDIFERICCRWMFPLCELFPLWSCHIEFVHFEIGVLLVQRCVHFQSFSVRFLLDSGFQKMNTIFWLFFSQYWWALTCVDIAEQEWQCLCFPCYRSERNAANRCKNQKQMHIMSCADDQAVRSMYINFMITSNLVLIMITIWVDVM